MRTLAAAIIAASLLPCGIARAQSTPQSYCATLPATSFEVLNIDLGGIAWNGNPSTSGYGPIIVKYCRNQVLYFVLGSVSFSTSSSTISFSFNGTLSTVSKYWVSNTSLASILP